MNSSASGFRANTIEQRKSECMLAELNTPAIEIDQGQPTKIKLGKKTTYQLHTTILNSIEEGQGFLES